MRGMRITVDAAMRARDVSRPRPADEEAATRAAAPSADQAQPAPGGSDRPQPPDGGRAPRGREDGPEPGADRPRPAASSRRRRSRRAGGTPPGR
jgi:hypothetical protein